MSLEKDAISPALKIGEKTTFPVNDKRPESERTFEEVKETLEAEYRIKKQEDFLLMSLLKLEQALRSEGVKILYQPPVQPRRNIKRSSLSPNSRNVFLVDRRGFLTSAQRRDKNVPLSDESITFVFPGLTGNQ